MMHKQVQNMLKNPAIIRKCSRRILVMCQLPCKSLAPLEVITTLLSSLPYTYCIFMHTQNQVRFKTSLKMHVYTVISKSVQKTRILFLTKQVQQQSSRCAA